MVGAAPNPDELLARVKEAEREAARGKLTIFFGAAPGVGKTYAMLEAARVAREDRSATSSSASSRRTAATTPRALAHRPRAPAAAQGRAPRRRRSRSSTSTPRSRGKPGAHPRRRARAHERAGLAPREALAGRRGAARRRHRRLHDAQRAAPREPQRRRRADHRRRRARDGARLACSTRPTRSRSSTCRPTSSSSACSEGKVYVPRAGARAPSRASSAKGNLIALRELALRRTAERVDAQMRGYKAAHGIERDVAHRRAHPRLRQPEPALGAPRPRGAPHGDEPARRAGSRLYVETPGVAPPVRRPIASALAREPAARRAARRRDGDAARTRTPRRRSSATRARATSRKIVVGKPTHPRWRDVVCGRRSSTRSCARAATSTSTSSRATSRRADARRAPPTASARARARPAATPRASPSSSLATAARAGSSSGARSSPTSSWSTCSASSSSSMRFGYGPSLLAAVLSVARVRLLLRPAVLQLRRHRPPPRRDVRGHVHRRRRHQQPHASASATRPTARASASGARRASTR